MLVFLLYAWILVCLILSSEAQQDRNQIILENGAFQNILIAIPKAIEEDPRIIENIKDIFTEGSSILFSATNRKFYFGTIKILVPHNWTRQAEYEVAQLEAYENANVIVTDQQSNHRPRVENPFRCGKEGLFIQLSKTFLIDPVLRQNQFGDSGKVIARQFAKLRWGVFDEDYVPGTDAEPYYPSNAVTATNGFEGTRCSSEVRGDLLDDDTGSPCQPDPTGNLPDSCRFVPSNDGQSARASLMFASNIYSIVTFCDRNADEGRKHNEMAPNLQNLKCDYQSVWEVMRKSNDFRFGNSPPLPEDTYTSPNFSVVQPEGTLRIVLVLDTSGSMDGERFEKMIKGASNFIQSVVPDNNYVGIVEFSDSSTVNSYMTQLTSVSSRSELESRLPRYADGSTCIGCGIRKGIEVAQYNGTDSRGAYLILLSDGLENEEPYIADTLGDIESSGVILHTIALYQADTQMEELAQMTGGTSYTCPDGGSAQCVISAFVSIIALRPQSIPDSAPIQVVSSSIAVDSGKIETTTIMIDASLGLDTIMTFTWAANPIITVAVIGPDGTSLDSSDPEYDIDTSSKIITITIGDAEAGLWDIEISNTYNVNSLPEEVSINVISKPRSEEVYPPVVNSFLGAKIVNYTSFPLVEVYAYVHTNFQPVIDATVIATVESTTSGNMTTIPLRDNGLGADLITGDGIYSAYFLDFSSNGRYGVKVDVNGKTTSSSNVGLKSKRDTGTPSSLQGFQRTTTAGVFQVENYSPDLNVDILAPSKITDFTSVERTYDENRNVTLVWTAVGDDLDQGTAASYELHFSDNFTQLRTNFTSTSAITDTDLIVGNLSQVASSGNLESISFLLPGEDSDAIFYFMIRAWDEAGNAGPISNIVSVSLRRLPPTTMAPTSKSPARLELYIIFIIAISCIVFLALLAISIAISVIYSRRNPKSPTGTNDNAHINHAYKNSETC
ncbi:calcium-activated chloride channel regulator 1-like [Lytechinus pictus]|uniref:calcium-activated chloride channel regulator 1-like n=1 Tax=Lytechinus pictus TaxID=7653 RepID=UPI0030B9E067